MRPLLFSRVWLASALFAASGCVTLADLPAPKDDASAPAQGDDPGQVVTEDPEDPEDSEDRGPDSPDVDAQDESPVPEVDSGKPELDGGTGPRPGPEIDAGTDAKVEVDAEICTYPYDWALIAPPNCRPPVPPPPSPPPFVECNVSADCGQNRYCVEHTCRDRFVCGANTDCSPGEACVDGTCRPQQACQSNNQCPQNQLCVASVCAPRCTADNACIVYQGPAGYTIRRLVTDENALYFSLTSAPEWSATGNAQLWRMVPGQAPTLVTDQLGPNMNFAVQDGYAYFRRGATFMRSRVAPDGPDQMLYAAPTPDTASWAIGANFVVFSGYDGFWVGNLEGTMSLHNIAQEPSGSPKEVLAKGDRFHFIGKTRTAEQWELSRIKTVRAVEPFTVEDASPLFMSDYNAIKDVRSPYAYFVPYFGGGPSRVNLTDGSSEYLPDFAGLIGSSSHISFASYSLFGDWLYSFEQMSDNQYRQIVSQRVTRYLLSDWTRKQVVLPVRLASESSASSTMAVLGQRFYTAKSTGPDIIYEMTLPAPPN